ncbi:pilus assembly PilX family protein [Syntrophotalea acetylenica]|uniref:Type 4 fimbrial biogenesis protein PilX N-terminal domain-containing protein n=1 Tax=Syntrophotalea acetylenica TaxID=29542 RepID=A0A1L3GHI0_SYNAC|nr:pilus assembly PilX N-terminal domain-containing protein [Syntrophotalea acetylenica]APG25391.1 hypothetical protein A7E75_10440 [Syntrophotalea acetylenica]MDY0262679.1 pilus assembly PilX N-terminal domain-containing protein [Syntrophotalea acetylenica]
MPAKIGRGQRGAALITAMVILTLLTVIGLAATNTSILETMISASDRTHTEALYTAEAGIEHLRRNFKTLFMDKNSSHIAAGIDPDWDFVLNGSQPDVAAATDTRYEGGAKWIIDAELGASYRYTVTVWNNDDGGGPTDDTDSVIFMRADARGPHGAAASVEISLFGGTSGGEALAGYGGQEGGGAGKNYNSNDAGAVSDFSLQID